MWWAVVLMTWAAIVSMVMVMVAVNGALKRLERIESHLVREQSVRSTLDQVEQHTAALERATGVDLLDLPPRLRTAIAAWRAVRRG